MKVPLPACPAVRNKSLGDDTVNTLRLLFRFLEVDDSFVPLNLDSRLNEQATKRLRIVNPTRVLRRVPGYGSISSLVPDPLRRFYRRAISRKVDHEELIRISPRSYEYLKSLVVPDLRRLLDATGVSFSEWNSFGVS